MDYHPLLYHLDDHELVYDPSLRHYFHLYRFTAVTCHLRAPVLWQPLRLMELLNRRTSTPRCLVYGECHYFAASRKARTGDRLDSLVFLNVTSTITSPCC